MSAQVSGWALLPGCHTCLTAWKQAVFLVWWAFCVWHELSGRMSLVRSWVCSCVTGHDMNDRDPSSSDTHKEAHQRCVPVGLPSIGCVVFDTNSLSCSWAATSPTSTGSRSVHATCTIHARSSHPDVMHGCRHTTRIYTGLSKPVHGSRGPRQRTADAGATLGVTRLATGAYPRCRPLRSTCSVAAAAERPSLDVDDAGSHHGGPSPHSGARDARAWS